MNLKNSIALVSAFFVLACNPNVSAADKAQKQKNQPAQPAVIKTASAVAENPAKTVQKTVEARYQTATAGYVSLEKVGFTQPKYTGSATVNGLGLKTAAELGLAGTQVYNEYEHSARIVTLSPLAKIYHDTASMEPVYLDGCMRGGKPFANRLKLVEPMKKAEPTPITVTAPIPKPVVYVRPETVVVANVQEKDIVVPIYSPHYEVTVHRQNIVYVPQQVRHPVKVWEKPNNIVLDSNRNNLPVRNRNDFQGSVPIRHRCQ